MEKDKARRRLPSLGDFCFSLFEFIQIIFFFLVFLLAVFTCKCTLETAMMMATSDENPTGGVNLLGCGSQVPRDAFST